MAIKPTFFEPVNDTKASLFTDLHQNFFHLRGFSHARCFKRIHSPQGLKPFDPKAIYIKRETIKPFGVKDFFSTLGKILLLATGVFPLIMLAAHAVDYKNKKKHYVVIENAGTDVPIPNQWRVHHSGATHKTDGNDKKNHSHNNSIYTSLLPQKTPPTLEPFMGGASLDSFTDGQIGQITLAQMATMTSKQKNALHVWIKAKASSQSPHGQGLPYESYIPADVNQISISSFKKVEPRYLRDHLEEIPPILWQLHSRDQADAIFEALDRMSQNRFDILVGPARIQELSYCNAIMYMNKLTDAYVPHLNDRQRTVFTTQLTSSRLEHFNDDLIPYLDMLSIKSDQFCALFRLEFNYIEDPNFLAKQRVLAPFSERQLTEKLLQKMTPAQINSCFANDKVRDDIKKLLFLMSDSQLQAIEPAHFAPIANEEIAKVSERKYTDAQLNAILHRYTGHLNSLPRERVQRLDFSFVYQPQFECLLGRPTPGKKWHEGLEEAFILKMYQERRIPTKMLWELPDALFHKLNFNLLTYDHKTEFVQNYYSLEHYDLYTPDQLAVIGEFATTNRLFIPKKNKNPFTVEEEVTK